MRLRAFAAAILVALPGYAWAATTWKAYTYNPVSTTSGAQGFKRIIDAIEKETNGELKIQMHLGGSLPIKVTDITQAVGDRVVEFADDGFFVGSVTIGGVIRLPMMIDTLDEALKAEAAVRPYVDRTYKKRGVVVLGEYNYPPQVLWSAKPMTSLADLAGRKIRVTSPEQSEFIKRMGGIGVTIGAPEVPSALERGVVDGVITASAGGGRIWNDLLTHNYRLGLNFFQSYVVVNEEAWSELKPEIRAKVQQIVLREAPVTTKNMFGEEDEITEMLRTKGMVVTPAKPEDIAAGKQKITPYWDEWAKNHGPEHIEALAKVRAAIGR